MQLYIINNQSSTDVITNSSSEIYAITDKITEKKYITNLFDNYTGLNNISLNRFNEYFKNYFEYSGMFISVLTDDDIDALVNTLKRIWGISISSNPWIICINDNDYYNRRIIRDILCGKLISDTI